MNYCTLQQIFTQLGSRQRPNKNKLYANLKCYTHCKLKAYPKNTSWVITCIFGGRKKYQDIKKHTSFSTIEETLPGSDKPDSIFCTDRPKNWKINAEWESGLTLTSIHGFTYTHSNWNLSQKIIFSEWPNLKNKCRIGLRHHFYFNPLH